MISPGVKTLDKFLTLLHELAPVNYTGLCYDDMGFTQVGRYLKYSRVRGLIVVVRTEQGRGKPSPFYSLTRLGQMLLSCLYEMEENLQSTNQTAKRDE